MADAFTVLDALIACGVDDVVSFMEQTQAERIAGDVFDDLFSSFIDISFKKNLMIISRHTPSCLQLRVRFAFALGPVRS
jgi:hypothetical protein